MSGLEIALFPCLSDNYGLLIHDPISGETAAIDTPEVSKIEAACLERGWTLTQIWNTHHHPDHTGGNLTLKQNHGLTITCLLYTSPSPRDATLSRMPSSA